MRNVELKRVVTEFAKYATPSGSPSVWREGKFKWTAMKGFEVYEIYANPGRADTRVLVVEV